jgi:hypothetical protein
MSITGYQEWAVSYATLFGLDRESDLRMVQAWEAAFESNRASAAELRAAAETVARAPPRWRSDHLIALQAAIREGRLSAWRQQREQEEAMVEEMRCVLCAWTGWVIVPHPEHIQAGRWVPHRGDYYTAAVLCICSRGTRILDGILAASEADRKKARVRVPMRLDAVERICPSWQEELKARHRQEMAEHKALAAAEELDRQHGRLGEAVRQALKLHEAT